MPITIGTPQQMTGFYSDVSAGPDGSAYAIYYGGGISGQVFQYNHNGGFNALADTTTMVSIANSPRMYSGNVAAVGVDGNVYMLDLAQNRWVRWPKVPVKATKVSFFRGLLTVLGSDGNIYLWFEDWGQFFLLNAGGVQFRAISGSNNSGCRALTAGPSPVPMEYQGARGWVPMGQGLILDTLCAADRVCMGTTPANALMAWELVGVPAWGAVPSITALGVSLGELNFIWIRNPDFTVSRATLTFS